MPATASAHRAVYRAPEVCEIAEVPQWRPLGSRIDLGVSKTADGPRSIAADLDPSSSSSICSSWKA
jgi:predicted butyrate kinase (DUF1464 family)